MDGIQEQTGESCRERTDGREFEVISPVTGKVVGRYPAMDREQVDRAVTAARQMAETLCRPAPLAVRAAKQAMLQGMNLSLGDGLELEKALNDFLVTTEDFDEGRKALAEKRKAVFKAN